MVGVRKWLRTKLKSNPKKQSQPSRSPLPLLPASGPRTPVPATTSGGVGTSQSQLLLDSYGYFALLPCELRDQILREAFGNRTLHIDLTYDFPLVRRARRPQVDHAEEHPSHCGLGHELARDASQPKGWQWFSCVCHRKKSYSEDELKQREYAMRRLRTIEPRDDQCLEGSMTECDPGGSACFIGVMGWLLSCRMAYSDAIQVLYSTNTFHISSLDLLLNLPRLVPAHHLRKVKSLELLWKLSVIHTSKVVIEDSILPLWENPTRQDTPLHVLCSLLPEVFPDVRKLYISLHSWLDPGTTRPRESDNISEMETLLLGPVEDMLRTLGPGEGKEFGVAIQVGAWIILLEKYLTLRSGAVRVDAVNVLTPGRFWKPLGPAAQVDRDESGTNRLEEDTYGYWVCGGWDDMHHLHSMYWYMSNWGRPWSRSPV